MPYYALSKSRSTSRYPKKRYGKGYRRPITRRAVAKIAKSVVNRSHPMREIRYPFPVGTLSTLVLANSFALVSLTSIPLGDNQDNRTGNRVFLAGAKMNLAFANDSATRPRAIRLMVLHLVNRDAETLDTTTWTDLYQSASYGYRTADCTSADLVYPLNTDLVKPLMDMTIRISTETANQSHYVFQKYLPIRKYVDYDGYGSSALDVHSGRIVFLAHLCEPDGTLTSSTVTSSGLIRVFFRDA